LTVELTIELTAELTIELTIELNVELIVELTVEPHVELTVELTIELIVGLTIELIDAKHQSAEHITWVLDKQFSDSGEPRYKSGVNITLILQDFTPSATSSGSPHKSYLNSS
jgi:hypothetical protein